MWVSDSTQQAFAFAAPAEGKKRGEDEAPSSLLPHAPLVSQVDKLRPPHDWVGERAIVVAGSGKNVRDLEAEVVAYDAMRGTWTVRADEGRPAIRKVGKENVGAKGGCKAMGEVWKAEVNFEDLCAVVSQYREAQGGGEESDD